MQISELINIINRILPPGSGMDKDRLGLQIQSGNTEVSKILVCMEINEDSIEEAKLFSCDCIISFHPLIFRPLLSIYEDERVGKLCTSLIKNSISFISIHTNFDAYVNGTSKILADKLELNTTGFLVPSPNYPNCGMGVIAESEIPLDENQIVERVSSVCNSPVRYSSGNITKGLTKFAIVGGSGSSFMDDAFNAGVDAFITADLTYHNFHAMKGKMALIDPGHYEMEQFVGLGLANLLEANIDINKAQFIVSQTYTNPVKYFPNSEKYATQQKEILLNIKNTLVN